MEQYQLYINGEFIPNGDREMFDVINPSTEEVIAQCPKATDADVQAAVDAAYEAEKTWGKTPAGERAAYLTKLAGLLREKQDFFADLIMREQGKNKSLAEIEAGVGPAYLDYMAGFAPRIEGDVIESDTPNENVFLMKMPIGVAAGIMPWNFPYFLIVRKLAPALVAGDTIILKPSSDTPIITYEFAKILDTIGLPKGVVNVLSGSGSTVGNGLSSNPKVGIVSMTGSVEVGSTIMEHAAKNITKVSLELGGKAPAIVMQDADLDKAADAIIASRIGNAGQVCNQAERCYVQESVAEEFTKIIIDKMSKVTVGVPYEGDYDMGPLINKKQVDGVHAKVQHAIEQGATLALGGDYDKNANGGKGFFYQPTVLTNCTQDMDIMHDETFGPVLPICTFTDLDQAIEYANDCEYGLASSIFTNNMNYMMRAMNEIHFGETYVNRWHFESINGFHQGVRKSGLGGDDGKYGFEEYMECHTCYVDWDMNAK
ncbi:MAG: aldehyde dehydrogenase [Coriobacteriales bacterium]|jgi:lactaldehyde dehydrogenase/glycolaldehyde dehydrogenase